MMCMKREIWGLSCSKFTMNFAMKKAQILLQIKNDFCCMLLLELYTVFLLYMVKFLFFRFFIVIQFQKPLSILLLLFFSYFANRCEVIACDMKVKAMLTYSLLFFFYSSFIFSLCVFARNAISYVKHICKKCQQL